MLANLQRDRDLTVARTAPDEVRDLLLAAGQYRTGRTSAPLWAVQVTLLAD